VASAYRHLGISRQALYLFRNLREQRDAAYTATLALVSDCHARQPLVGARKVHRLTKPKLQAAEIALG